MSSDLNPDTTPFMSVSTTFYVEASKTVLLQTAQTILYNPDSPHIALGA